MKLHSDVLTIPDIEDALRTAKATGRVDNLIHLDTLEVRKSRSRKNGYEIQLVWDGTKVKGDGRRWKNSGHGGSDSGEYGNYAATRDEWGWFIDAVFNLDPAAVFGPYNGRIDFHKATRYAYGE